MLRWGSAECISQGLDLCDRVIVQARTFLVPLVGDILSLIVGT